MMENSASSVRAALSEPLAKRKKKGKENKKGRITLHPNEYAEH